MPRFTPKRYEQIMPQMVSKVVSRTRLSDVSNTSVWKHVLSAAARQDDEQYYQMTLVKLLFDLDKCTGNDLDERAKEIQPGTLERDSEIKSAGTVVFSRNATTGSVIIPVNTIISTSGGKQYTTTAAGSITPSSPALVPGHSTGQDSGLIPVIAVEGGADGNVAAGTVVKFVTKPPGTDEVTNLTAMAYGADEETDDAFRTRIRQYISTLARSTVEAIEFSVLGAVDPDTGATIMSAHAVEDIINRGYVTLYIDDGTGTASTIEAITAENVTEGLAGPPVDSAVGGEEYLFLDNKPIDETILSLSGALFGSMVQGTDYYVDPTSGQLYFTTPLVATEVITANYTRYTGLIELAQKIIDGDPNDRTNYPGYRAAGVWVQVTTPQILIQTVELSIVVAEGYDDAEVESNVLDAIRDYINALGVSGDVLRSEIIRRVKSVAGVYDLTLITPSSNVILLDDQMARTTDSNITIN